MQMDASLFLQLYRLIIALQVSGPITPHDLKGVGWMQASTKRQTGILPTAPNITAKSMSLCTALNSYRSALQTLWFLAGPVYCDPAMEDTSVCVCLVKTNIYVKI